MKKKLFLIAASLTSLAIGLVVVGTKIKPGITRDPALKKVIENSTTEVLKRRKEWTKPASKELTQRYLPFWEKLFKEKNNLSDSYFKKHIKVVYTSTATDEDRQLSSPGIRGKEYFFVDAVFSLDWLSFVVSSELVIREAGSDEFMPLNQIEGNKQYVKISPLQEITRLPYSFPEILAALHKINPEAKDLKLEDFRSYSLEGTKVIYLSAFGTINEIENECTSIQIDVLTLKWGSGQAFCRIY